MVVTKKNTTIKSALLNLHHPRYYLLLLLLHHQCYLSNHLSHFVLDTRHYSKSLSYGSHPSQNHLPSTAACVNLVLGHDHVHWDEDSGEVFQNCLGSSLSPHGVHSSLRLLPLFFQWCTKTWHAQPGPTKSHHKSTLPQTLLLMSSP